MKCTLSSFPSICYCCCDNGSTETQPYAWAALVLGLIAVLAATNQSRTKTLPSATPIPPTSIASTSSSSSSSSSSQLPRLKDEARVMIMRDDKNGDECFMPITSTTTFQDLINKKFWCWSPEQRISYLDQNNEVRHVTTEKQRKDIVGQYCYGDSLVISPAHVSTEDIRFMNYLYYKRYGSN